MNDTPPAVGGRVLSASALIDFASARTEYTRAVVAMAIRTGTLVLAIPATGLAAARAEVSDAGRRQLDTLTLLTPCVVDELTTQTAARVGDLLASTSARPGSDLVAAGQTLWVARTRKWPVITSTADGRTLHMLALEVELEHLP